MSKTRVFLATLILSTSLAFSVDRVSYVSVSTFFPREIKPEKKVGDISQSIKFAVFFNERLANVFGVDLGVSGRHRSTFTAGFQWYLSHTHVLDPYVNAAFLYKFNDDNKLGWRSTVGVEWNARPISNMDNLRLFMETGTSFVFDDVHQLWLEMIHLGASWHF